MAAKQPHLGLAHPTVVPTNLERDDPAEDGVEGADDDASDAE